MENPIPSSQILIHSDKFVKGQELVLVVGYTEEGKFGYFITYLTNENTYDNTISFIVRENCDSYTRILKCFKELIV